MTELTTQGTIGALRVLQLALERLDLALVGDRGEEVQEQSCSRNEKKNGGATVHRDKAGRKEAHTAGWGGDASVAQGNAADEVWNSLEWARDNLTDIIKKRTYAEDD